MEHTKRQIISAIARWAVGVLVLSCVNISQAQDAEALHKMWDENQIFALRDMVDRTNTPMFYSAVVEDSYNRIAVAQKHLRMVIASDPHSNQAYEAHEVLTNLYFRNGMYREAFIELQAQMAERPEASDVKAIMPLLRALSGADMTVVSRKHSKLKMRTADGTLFVPLTVNGKDATYPFDTGANISMLSESEAKRLGMAIQAVDSKFGDSSGNDLKGFHIAIAKDLRIGGLHLKNVAFGVVPDSNEPFVEQPEGSRGLLGLPVLLAMQTLRWGTSGTFELSFPSPAQTQSSNLLFHGMTPVVQVSAYHTLLNFSLDTGAVNTDLNPEFAKKFPDTASSGEKETHKITGFGGSSNYDSILLPPVDFVVGGRHVVLKPAHMFVTYSLGSHWVGNLGMDLLGQTHAVVIDFRNMSLQLN